MNRTCRRAGRWMASAALVLPVLALTASDGPVAAQAPTPPTTITFNATGQPQSWTAPDDVHQATITAVGARGGDSDFYDGGYGGQATATFVINPGETLDIYVGGRGLDWEVGNCAELTNGPPTGGWNGGGNGGGTSGCQGAGGGGASDVRRDGIDLSNRVLVAGGGGGASSDCSDAGAGGGLVGGSAGCGGGAGGDQDGTSGSGEQGLGGTGGDGSFIGAGGGGGFYGGAGAGGENLGGGGGSGYGPAGTWFETGVNPGDGYVTVSFGAAAPTITAVSPSLGPARGGSGIVITGTNFAPVGAQGFQPILVYFGTTQADTRQLTCTATECQVAAPAGAGMVDVRVDVAGQISLDSPADDYTYVGNPTITSLDPSTAPKDSFVTLNGTNLLPQPYVTELWFGPDLWAQATCSSLTQCSVYPSPPGLGPVDASVVTPQGRSNSIQFTRVPGVYQLSPESGPAGGGTAVRISGTDFDMTPGHTDVRFGDAAVEAIGCASTTECTVVSPPGTGTVEVHVTVDGWENLESPGNTDFTYTADATQPVSPVPVDVRFDEDSTALRPEDEPFLRGVVAAVQAAPPSATVTIDGHADSGGPDDYNDELSQRRAQAVTDWLVGVGGVAADRITTAAYGERLPIAANESAEGRAVNRRATITITPG
jgi:outer membrane protein OmpA-like peptidoglycan-associated protein